MTLIEINVEERDVLRRHKECSPHKLVLKKSDAILLASQGADTEFIAEFVDRSPKTVSLWLSDFKKIRLASVVTGHVGNLNASKLSAEQRDQLVKVLSRPVTDLDAVPARFWDVPTLANWVETQFDVVYENSSSYHFLLRYAGLSFHKPEPFDRRRDEAAIEARMAQIRPQVTALLAKTDWEVFTADEVRIDQEAEIRRAWLPIGEKTVIKVDREKQSQSYIGFLNQKTGSVELAPLPWQNTQHVTAALTTFVERHPDKHIAIVWDNASWHTSKHLREQLATGKPLERLHLIAMPPYAPDHNPIEHVWGQAKQHISNIQRHTFNETTAAFEHYITTNTFPYRITKTPHTEQRHPQTISPPPDTDPSHHAPVDS